MNRHRTLLACILVGLAARPASADHGPPPGYYAPLPAVAAGEPLKSALHQIVRDHTTVSYSPGVWNALYVLDQDPANPANVLLLYSGDSRAISLQDPGNHSDNYWNREHVWPVSRGMNNSTASIGGRDLHHIFAADKDVNARRASLPFDRVADGPGVATDPEAPLSRYTNLRYEPRDADKGRIARALFYMAVRYEGGDGMEDLELQDPIPLSGARMASLPTLLSWHRAFPPTEAERVRNHKVQTLYQGNRNPFIDNPLLADRIFNGDTPYGAWLRPHFAPADFDNAALAGDAADPDGDGLPNLLEYAFNLHPRSFDAPSDTKPELILLPPLGLGAPDRLALTHRLHRHATDLTVRYEVSTDLASWDILTPSATHITTLDAQTQRVTIEAPANGPHRFLRIRVQRAQP